MKNLVLLSSLLTGILAGCVGQDLGGPIQSRVDAAPVRLDSFIPPDAPPDAGPAAGCVDRGTPGTAFIHPATGNARAGEGCMGSGPNGQAGGCHLNGQTGNIAPAFQFAGTVYKVGTQDPDPGAIIIITPDNPAVPPIQTIADTAGNFWVAQISGQAIPASASVTTCPNLTSGHTSGKIRTGTGTATGGGNAGNCNGCHALVADGGSQEQIHVVNVVPPL